MPFSLLPAWQAPAVTDVMPSFLQSQNIRLVMLDFDNTLVPYTAQHPTEPVLAWLESLQQAGLTVCIVSNSRKQRVPEFCSRYGLDCVTHAHKPFTGGICQCLRKYGVDPSQAVIIGDQIFTDTLGGNCAGVTTILVKAIHNHNIWLKLRHAAEMPFIAIAKNRRITK